MYRTGSAALKHNERAIQAYRSYLTERIGAQLDFAQFLHTRYTRETIADGDARLREIRALIEDTGVSVGNLEKAVADAEAALAPFSKVAKSFDIHCVGHAHIDMNWMWSWPETVSVTVDSMTTVLTLLDTYPDFTFSQSQASIYRILERYRPDLLDRVRAHVADGRWEVTASHWVECEKNIVNGESLCRHLLYTRRYMKELFGLEPEDVPIDWSPDTFGHAETVPNYLTRGGIRYLYLHRPGAHYEQPVPRVFTWTGTDGSRVLVRNDMHLGYNGVISPRMVPACLIPMYDEHGLNYSMYVYGVGDHGGGPTKRDIERLIDMQSWPVFPTIRFSRAVDYFSRLAQDGESLPVRTGELNFEFTGCYTSQSLIKRANRLSESALLQAEQAVSLAGNLADSRVDGSRLETAWEHTLFNHFHDILPGSGVHDTRTYAHGLFQESSATIQSVMTQALREVAGRIDTTPPDDPFSTPGVPDKRVSTWMRFGGGVGFGASETGVSAYGASDEGPYPYVLFNATASPRYTAVEAVIWDPGSWDDDGTPEGFEYIDPDGVTGTVQILESGRYWGHRFVRVAFPVSIRAWGYARYFIREAPVETGETASREPRARQTGYSHICHYASYERGPEGIENERILVDIDPTTGAPAKIFDKDSGIVLDTRGMGLEYFLEQPGAMSAWRIQHTSTTERPRCITTERVGSGPWNVGVRCRFETSQSEFTVTYSLSVGDPILDIEIEGTWFERGDEKTGIPGLRFVLPVSPETPRFTFEEPFGAIERSFTNGEELPAYRWASVAGSFAGTEASCVLYNDTKHGYSYRDGRLYLTLIRSSYDPDPIPEVGRHRIRLGVEIVPGICGTDVIARKAEAFTCPVHVVHTSIHPGELPAASSWLTCRNEHGEAVIGAIKPSEDGSGLIVRIYNPGKTQSSTVITCAGLLGVPVRCVETDILERELTELPLGDSGEVCVEAGPGTIITIKLVM